MFKIALMFGGATLLLAVVAVMVIVRTRPVTLDDVQPLTATTASASVVLRPDGENAQSATIATLKARLTEVALSDPGTTAMANVGAAGERYFVTRSRLWGFPDVTVVRAGSDAEGDFMALFAKPVFGSYDWNVNARRLERWRAEVEQADPL